MDGLPETITYKGEQFETPDWETMEEWLMDSICETLDGCIVEHDGRCPHGYPSWFLALGLI
jgi:putative heme iron utilization protein